MIKRTIKNILKYGSLLGLLGMAVFISNELFIIDWRIKHSEERVQKSIKSNFQDKSEEFRKFKDFVYDLDINPNTDIEFLRGNRISVDLSSHLMTDSSYNNSIPFYFSSEEEETDIGFELGQDGTAKISYQDTIFEIHNWAWHFIGGEGDEEFKKFIEYIGISQEQLASLRRRIEELDCETIWIHRDKSISIRFDGIRFYQYQYYFPGETGKVPPEYEKLADGIYAGMYHSGFYCGWVIFDK